MRGDPEPKPEVGMGATLQVGSDTYAFTIREVCDNGRTIIATVDYAGENADREKFTLRRDGCYRKSGSHHFRLYVGERRDYRDPSF